MPKVFFCSDPHGHFAHIIYAVKTHKPAAIVLLVDQTAKKPLDIELLTILDKTKSY